MGTTSKDKIREWYEDGKAKGHTYMFIIDDLRSSYPFRSYFPVYADDVGEARTKADAYRRAYRGHINYEALEIYNLSRSYSDNQFASANVWELYYPDDENTLPAFGRFEFMAAKNLDYIKTCFGGDEKIKIYPVRVLKTQAMEDVYRTSAYILERETKPVKSAAAVYRFAPDGETETYCVTLWEQGDEFEFAAPLPQYHEVKVDEPRLTFGLRFAIGKDPESPAYRHLLINETYTWDNTNGFKRESGAAEAYVDLESQENHNLKDDHMRHKAASEGNADALYALAENMDNSAWSHDASYASAYYYKRAACLGHVKAMYAIAMMYDTGDSVAKDKEKALYWIKQAARGGHHNAIKSLERRLK